MTKKARKGTDQYFSRSVKVTCVDNQLINQRKTFYWFSEMRFYYIKRFEPSYVELYEIRSRWSIQPGLWWRRRWPSKAGPPRWQLFCVEEWLSVAAFPLPSFMFNNDYHVDLSKNYSWYLPYYLLNISFGIWLCQSRICEVNVKGSVWKASSDQGLSSRCFGRPMFWMVEVVHASIVYFVYIVSSLSNVDVACENIYIIFV